MSRVRRFGSVGLMDTGGLARGGRDVCCGPPQKCLLLIVAIVGYNLAFFGTEINLLLVTVFSALVCSMGNTYARSWASSVFSRSLSGSEFLWSVLQIAVLKWIGGPRHIILGVWRLLFQLAMA
jgi:hypothetical protein